MGVRSVNLTVRGMTCANCARTVIRKLTSTPGVVKATVDLQSGLATVVFDSGAATPEALASAVRQLGYEVLA